MTVNVALTIAGSDSGGGAGIQADLKTFQELGVFGTSALTAVTAQNTNGVHDVYPVPTDSVTAQIRAVLDDFDVKACKTGMLFSADIIQAVAAVLKEYPSFPLIIDPVMIAKGGHTLLQQEAIQAMKSHLIPMSSIITPNIPEAEVLTKMKIASDEDIQQAAQKFISMGADAVIIKGGHRSDVLEAKDYFLDCDGQSFTMTTPWVQTKDTHGTGCTFAAALTGFIARGCSMPDAVAESKQFIQAAIENGLRLGSGHGPTNHWAYNQLKKEMH